MSPALGTTASHRHELLAPAGGPEAFAAALAAGADAVYCGLGAFNARRKAENFTEEAFAAACRSAHLAGARVYVTVNIVIKDAEMPQALELVRRSAAAGADAFIIQDWGLFFEVKRLMPELETHLSTQANVHDARGCAWCREAGADRVTLSRELSLQEIAACAQAGIELEVFAHGSLCFSYSGLCLLSGMVSGTAEGRRSANRGMCAQPCRLPYELVDEVGAVLSAPGRERALCPRDNCTAFMLPELLETGAYALKLEGRMKAPEYVHEVVEVYRRQLDDAEAGRTPGKAAEEARARQLKRAFNRDFTCAYQQGRSGDEMMSYERSNNRGQIVGEVVGSRPVGGTRGLHPDDRRRRAAWVCVRLCEPVGAGDLLELRHDAEWDQFLTAPVAADAVPGEVIEVRAARAMPTGACARVIRSQAALDAADAALKRLVPRKRAVDVAVRARLGEPFEVVLTCCDDPELSASASGFMVEPAHTRAVGAAELAEHVGRMGASPFEAALCAVELDPGCGMAFSAVHRVRAEACAALERRILAPYEERAAALATLPAFAATAITADAITAGAAPARPAAPHRRQAARLQPEVCALAATPEAAQAARRAGATRIYLSADALSAAGLSPAEAAEQGLIPVLDEVCRADDHARLDPWVQPGAPVAVGNVSELALARERGAAAEARSCLPVHNAACLRALAARGAAGFWLSPELTLAEIEQLGATAVAVAPDGAAGDAAVDAAAGATLGLTVLGRVRLMTSEHCILQVAGRCIHDCARCDLRQQRLWLKNIDGKLLPVRTDVHGRSRLYDARPLDLTPELPRLLAAGVTRYLVDGTLMEPDELERMVGRVRRAVDAALAGRKPAKRLQNHSSGCLFDGVL